MRGLAAQICCLADSLSARDGRKERMEQFDDTREGTPVGLVINPVFTSAWQLHRRGLDGRSQSRSRQATALARNEAVYGHRKDYRFG